MMRKTGLGGTFDILHAGHKALIRKAIETGGRLLIGLTNDEMAGRTRDECSRYAARERNLAAYLRKKGVRGFHIVPIDDEFGPAAKEDLNAIVVSAEKMSVAVRINEERARRGLQPLEIVTIPMVLAEDCLPIASRRVRAGEIDRDGRMAGPLRINVGTANAVKVRAAKSAVSAFYSKVRVRGVAAESEVPPEPMERYVIIGAINRAKGALGDGDFGVGIEAGLFWNDIARDFVDIQYCAVIDKAGRLTVGHGPGFVYPPSVISLVKNGMTVGQAMERITGIKGMGRREGAIGYLSKGRLVREELTRMAVIAAFLPRIRRELYL